MDGIQISYVGMKIYWESFEIRIVSKKQAYWNQRVNTKTHCF